MTRVLPLSATGRDHQWQDTYEELAYTAFALATQSDDATLAKLHMKIVGVLADWERIEADRRGLRGQAIAARAAVRVADAALDYVLGSAAETVLEECDGDRDSAHYRRFFPEPHELVIELGLDGEIPAASVVMAQLDQGGELSDAMKAYIAPLRQCLRVGNGALVQRADSYAALGRLAARVEAWLEDADAMARTLHTELTRLGEARGLSYRWTASFFVHGTPLA